MAATDDGRPGKVVALKEVEAQRPAMFHLLAGLDFLGEYLERQAQQRADQIDEGFSSRLHINLYDAHQRQQCTGAWVEAGVAGQRQCVAAVAQQAATGEHVVVRHSIEIEFQHHGIRRQQLDHIIENEGFVGVDEGLVRTERVADA